MLDTTEWMSNIPVRMSNIRTDALDDILAALGEQLASRRSSQHLVVIGGSALLAAGLADRPTQDVDVVAFVVDGRLVSAAPFPEALDASAARVAEDFGLKSGWLNPGPTSLLEIGGLPEGFAERMSTNNYGSLTVSFASRLDQIHLKLYAAADRDEPRDEADLRRLDPQCDELQAAAAWIRTHNAPGPFDDRIEAVLAAFGVQDAGRRK